MNLAVLAKMVRDGDLSLQAASYLVACRAECEALDYKESLNLENDPRTANTSHIRLRVSLHACCSP